MLRMVGISVQSLARLKFRHQTRVKRPVKMQNVRPDIQTRDAGDELRQFSETSAVFVASGVRDVGFVFPADDVDEHGAIFSRNGPVSM